MNRKKYQNMSSKNHFNNSNVNNININNNYDNNLKLRRVNSVTRLSEIKDYEKKIRKERVDQPYGSHLFKNSFIFILILLFRVHEPKDSLFSSSSGYTNYRGLLNLCVILLVIIKPFVTIILW